jgi:hypothetical protein
VHGESGHRPILYYTTRALCGISARLFQSWIYQSTRRCRRKGEL